MAAEMGCVAGSMLPPPRARLARPAPRGARLVDLVDLLVGDVGVLVLGGQQAELLVLDVQLDDHVLQLLNAGPLALEKGRRFHTWEKEVLSARVFKIQADLRDFKRARRGSEYFV